MCIAIHFLSQNIRHENNEILILLKLTTQKESRIKEKMILDKKK